jgi:ferrochelatase
MSRPYDAVLVVSFGGPDGPEDVLPFLENVLRGRNVPRERMMEVAEHYYAFGGRSPINDQNRTLVAALETELAANGLKLPVYWGNRNWHPLLADTLRKMAADGVRRALAFVTSAYSSYSSCRQYLENIAAARELVTAGGPPADERQVSRLSPPEVDKLRAFFNHPGFIEPMVENTLAALEKIPAERRANAQLLFTAHSIPTTMAATSRYEEQLREASRLVADGAGLEMPWKLLYQSRSGPPQQPWLEPDVADYLRGVAGVEAKPSPEESARTGGSLTLDPSHPRFVRDVVIVPIGFISDHMEIVYDLDTEVRRLCERLGINMVRAATVGTHPRFVRMIRELIQERMNDSAPRLALGDLGPSHDECASDCCAYTPRWKSKA